MPITMHDIQRLARNPSVEARADIAGKVASTLSAGVLTNKEAELAAEILRTLARDTEMRVRRAIAAHLADAMAVPRDLVMDLARDATDVSLPLLQRSYALTEEDLIAIVRSTREVAKLVAIASRDSISGDLSEALMETSLHDVMQALFANKGAVIRDHDLLKRWETIIQHHSLLEVLVQRGGLSMVVAEKLYTAVAEELKTTVARMYHLPLVVTEDAADDAREWATLGLTETGESVHASSEPEVERLVDHLFAHDRLSHSLVIRSLCIGDMVFFEAAMARLAGVPRPNARILMFDSGALGFKAIYEKSRLSPGFYEAVHTLFRISLEETGCGRFRRDDFRRRVIARIQSAGLDRTVENMPYLLTIIGGRIASAETIH